VTFLCRVHF